MRESPPPMLGNRSPSPDRRSPSPESSPLSIHSVPFEPWTEVRTSDITEPLPSTLPPDSVHEAFRHVLTADGRLRDLAEAREASGRHIEGSPPPVVPPEGRIRSWFRNYPELRDADLTPLDETQSLTETMAQIRVAPQSVPLARHVLGDDRDPGTISRTLEGRVIRHVLTQYPSRTYIMHKPLSAAEQQHDAPATDMFVPAAGVPDAPVAIISGIGQGALYRNGAVQSSAGTLTHELVHAALAVLEKHDLLGLRDGVELADRHPRYRTVEDLISVRAGILYASAGGHELSRPGYTTPNFILVEMRDDESLEIAGDEPNGVREWIAVANSDPARFNAELTWGLIKAAARTKGHAARPWRPLTAPTAPRREISDEAIAAMALDARNADLVA